MLAGVRFGVQAVASTTAIGLRNDEIESEILRASSASEFLQPNFRSYTRERISYWLCEPAALELRRSQDGRNAVRLRRAEG